MIRAHVPRRSLYSLVRCRSCSTWDECRALGRCARPLPRTLPPEHLARYLPDALEFVECDICAAKPGMPMLCEGCLHNRAVISELTRRLEMDRRTTDAAPTDPASTDERPRPEPLIPRWLLWWVFGILVGLLIAAA